LPVPEALAIMREEAARGWWDQSLLNEFETRVLERAFPVGSRVS
jgi:hypothetical protein